MVAQFKLKATRSGQLPVVVRLYCFHPVQLFIDVAAICIGDNFWATNVWQPGKATASLLRFKMKTDIAITPRSAAGEVGSNQELSRHGLASQIPRNCDVRTRDKHFLLYHQVSANLETRARQAD